MGGRSLKCEYNPLPMKKTKDNDQMALAGTEEAEILGRLSERVEKAVATIQELRKERDQLKKRVEELESQVTAQDEAEEQQERLRKERSEIRDRIENILSALEGLETE
jgi:FtsZ-binding cell division protein ZapB